MKRKLNSLMQDRAGILVDAEAALAAGNKADYDACMEKVSNLNEEITNTKHLLDEQARYAMEAPVSPAEIRDRTDDRYDALRHGRDITFSAAEIHRAFANSEAGTLASGPIAMPTAAGTEIRGNNPVPSIVDQVTVTDLSGTGGILEPYVISEQAAQAGTLASVAGEARTASDPTFGMAKIAPYEVSVTSYVDRNIARLSPANYVAKVEAMALNALRRKVADLIVNGDAESTHVFFGIKNAKNTAGANIYATKEFSAAGITADTLMELYFALGTDDSLNGDARLYLNKADLKAIGEIRGTNEKRRIFEITPDAGNMNSGVITDGGFIVPYTIVSDLTALSTAVKGSAAIQTMLYGAPLAYELGLFGDYSIRIDESYKAAERMTTIMGDVLVGGNLVADKGFVVATLAHS